jgi:hypothetical protein
MDRGFVNGKMTWCRLELFRSRRKENTIITRSVGGYTCAGFHSSALQCRAELRPRGHFWTTRWPARRAGYTPCLRRSIQ